MYLIIFEDGSMLKTPAITDAQKEASDSGWSDILEFKDDTVYVRNRDKWIEVEDA